MSILLIMLPSASGKYRLIIASSANPTTFHSNLLGEETRYQINVIEMYCIDLSFFRNFSLLNQIPFYWLGIDY